MRRFQQPFASKQRALSAAQAFCNWCLPVALAIGGTGCTNSTRTMQSSGATNEADPEKEPSNDPPRGEPVEVPGLTAVRSVYQSRNVITLDVHSSQIEIGNGFSLVNDTTGVALIREEPSRLAFAGLNDIGWLLGANDVTLKIYLLSPQFANSFAPGANRLRLLASSSGNDAGRFAKTQVTLRDFTVFGQGTGVFESGEQRAGGFEGSFVPFANPVVASDGKSLLVTGFGSIVNK